MISSLALVINTKPILEKDTLVELFTLEYGRIRAFAKYSQSKKPRFGGQLNTFNLCLNHVKSCYSVFDNKVMPAYDGCLRWTNVGKKHWVVNMNRQPQYQIIWQGIYKKQFRQLVMENK